MSGGAIALYPVRGSTLWDWNDLQRLLEVTALDTDGTDTGEGETAQPRPTELRPSSASSEISPRGAAGRQKTITNKVFYTPRAANNIKDLQDYIAAHNPTAAFQIVTIIRQRISNLIEYPRTGRPGRVSGTRELIISHTPYIVSYRVNESRIEVLAVLHGARRWPDKF